MVLPLCGGLVEARRPFLLEGLFGVLLVRLQLGGFVGAVGRARVLGRSEGVVASEEKFIG
jgi:hypothetical protein